MNPYLAIFLFLAVIPFLIGMLYSLIMTLYFIVLLLLVIFPTLIFILKLAIDKRRATKDLWQSRLESCWETQEQDLGVDLSVVVPAYNEEQRLPTMLDEALDFLEARHGSKSKCNNMYESSKGFRYEIIVVDDGSVDKTTECGLSYHEKLGDDRVRVITLEKNRGKGGAVRAGVLAARGKYVIFADADGASKFSDIEKLEEFMHKNRQSKFVVAIGSRAHMEKDAIASRSLFRTILMKGFHLLVWICCVRTVRDTQCGFKMFNRAAAELLFSNYHNESWAFDVELLYLAEQTKCTIGEIAINWKEVEGSKIVPIFSWIRMGWDVICLATFYTIGIYHVPHEQAKKFD